MDPSVVWPVVGLIATGGGIAAVAGFIGSGTESRREHKRWLRNQRLEAYVHFIDLCDRFTLATVNLDKFRIEQPQALNDVRSAATRVALLGPKPMEMVASRLADTVSRWLLAKNGKKTDHAEYARLRRIYLEWAHLAVGVSESGRLGRYINSDKNGPRRWLPVRKSKRDALAAVKAAKATDTELADA